MTTKQLAFIAVALMVMVAYGAFLKTPRKIVVEFKRPELAKEILEAEKKDSLYRAWMDTPTRIAFKKWYKVHILKQNNNQFINSLKH